MVSWRKLQVSWFIKNYLKMNEINRDDNWQWTQLLDIKYQIILKSVSHPNF